MKIPKTIKIGGHDYSVKFPYSFKEDVNLCGQCDNSLLEIRVAKFDYSGSVKPDSCIAATILHEIIHALDYCSGMRALCEGKEAQEQIVEMVAQGFYQVFINNPELLNILKRQVKK